MSAFKQLLTSDIIVSPFEVNKSFDCVLYPKTKGYGAAVYGVDVYGSASFETNCNIDRFKGINGDFFTNKDLTGFNDNEYQVLIYNSVKELYYTNYLSSSLGSETNQPVLIPGSDPSGDRLIGDTYTPSYYNYLSTDLSIPRFIPTSSGDIVGVISIPSSLFGEKLLPGSIRITSGGFTLLDDGEGTLYTNERFPGFNFGNVIYEHGIIILTNSGSYCNGDGEGPTTREGYGFEVYGRGGTDYGGDITPGITIPSISSFLDKQISLSFSSSFDIIETQYQTTIKENEFNLSLNPTLITDSEGGVRNFVTSSYFSPYITTVGLYNDNQELLAIGKLSQPLPTSRTTDTNIFINIDR
tara:strand:+ start:10552 stop:11616 length:1065 start_codon:yes stop_codon:yes gene_type:complete